MFRSIHLENWRQFRRIDVEFHPRLTVLTGANGAGKTTILNILSKHFGWSSIFVSTPVTRKGVLKYFSGLFGRADDLPPGQVEIGRLVYASGTEARLSVPSEGDASFDVAINGQEQVSGIYLPSHRPVYSYRRVDQIPTRLDARAQLFDQYLGHLRQWYSASARIESPSYHLKAALISLATFGYGNEVVEPNEEALETFVGFQRILQSVLPPQLGFKRLAIRMPDLVFECEGGDFSLDAASGGVAAIVDVAWQIYMKSLLDKEFVVLADEPENHLHPELQRALLPGLMKAFPAVQFIAATHNPFIVTSVPEAHVFVLRFDEGRVVSAHLAETDRAGSANKILMDVLGVPFPMPLWVEQRVEEIAARLEAAEITRELLTEVKQEMTEMGLGHLFPDVVERVLGEGSE